jgi:hypothetical protein
MEIAAVFIAFLTPLFALIAGLALVTFSSLKSACPPRKLVWTGLFLGLISALGWVPALLSSAIGLWIYLGVVGASALCGSMLILFVTAGFVTTDVLTEKLVDEPAHRSLRAQYDYILLVRAARSS